ncbi:MAG: TylF/MycF/NovP-related O-methyltransferase [Halioglobus sp.]
MIKLPEFDEQSRYDYETNFHLTLEISRLAKFVAHYEAYNMVANLPGAIVECGVFKGTSITRFALLRELLGNHFSAKILAFDVFSDDFPDTQFEEDKAQREHWIETAGGSSISVEQLEDVFKRMNVQNYELVAGDICETVPAYMAEHAGLKISLLNVDCDFVEPTRCALEHMYDRVVRGGIILLDNYAGEGTTGLSYHGDTRGTDEFFADKDVVIRKFPFGARPCYIIKE